MYNTTVLFPGTFDPITLGHRDLIERTSTLFPRLIVAVANNPSKKTMLDFATRIALVKASLADLNNVEVVGFSGLLVDLVKESQAHAIIRGLRNTVDFEYENQLAKVNAHLAKGVQTLFLTSSETFGFISSTVVREVFLHQGDISNLVPKVVADYLNMPRKS